MNSRQKIFRSLVCILLFWMPLTMYAQDIVVDSSINTDEGSSYDTAIVSMPPAEDGSYSAEDGSEAEAPIPVADPWPQGQSQVMPRKADAQAVNKLRADDDFWYADHSPVREENKDEDRPPGFLTKSIVVIILILVVVIFLGLVIWFLVASDVSFFRKSPVKNKSSEVVDEHEDIFAIDYDAEIAKAEAASDHAMAIRLHYLQLLKILSEKHLIDYRQERTNSEYLSQLFNRPFYRNFFQLTRHFEYAWYGKLPVSTGAYGTISGQFRDFKNNLH